MESQSSNNLVDNLVNSFLGRKFIIAIRWLLTTTWFLLLVNFVFVGLSLYASIAAEAWHWFQRSGAIMVSIGAILSTRRALYLVFANLIDDHQCYQEDANTSAELEWSELKTCVCGFLVVAMGTLIWAYGDLFGCVFYWNPSCVI